MDSHYILRQFACVHRRGASLFGFPKRRIQKRNTKKRQCESWILSMVRAHNSLLTSKQEPPFTGSFASSSQSQSSSSLSTGLLISSHGSGSNPITPTSSSDVLSPTSGRRASMQLDTNQKRELLHRAQRRSQLPSITTQVGADGKQVIETMKLEDR